MLDRARFGTHRKVCVFRALPEGGVLFAELLVGLRATSEISDSSCFITVEQLSELRSPSCICRPGASSTQAACAPCGP